MNYRTVNRFRFYAEAPGCSGRILWKQHDAERRAEISSGRSES